MTVPKRCQTGGPYPHTYECLTVASLVHISGDPLIYRKRPRSARRTIDNYIKNFSDQMRLTIKYGLIDFGIKNSGKEANQNYYIDNSDIELTIYCFPERSSALYPSCQAHMFWKKRNMGVRISFAAQLLPRWKEVIESARSLFDRFRVAN